jgi:HK97 gp10 family phage protein
MAITIEIKNLDEAFKKFNNMSNTVKKNIKNEVAASALNIQSNAKKLAPINLGKLRQSIYINETSKGQNEFMFTIGAAAKYAPYIEFGTGGKVSIPSGFSDEASKFKGKTGGKFSDLVKALTEWVSKKGIASGKKSKSVAYAIALSIIRRGIRPQPFLIPSFQAEKPKLITKIKDVIRNAKS